MTEESNFELVSIEAFESLMGDVKARPRSLTRTGSRYRDLAEVAGIHQEFARNLG